MKHIEILEMIFWSLNIEGEGILEHPDGKCHVFTLYYAREKKIEHIDAKFEL